MSAECSKKNSRRFPDYQKMSLSRNKKKAKEREAPKEFSHYGIRSIYIIGPLEITIKRDTLALSCMYSETNKQKARHNNPEKEKHAQQRMMVDPNSIPPLKVGKKSKGGRETHKKKKKNICNRNPRRGCCFHNV